MDNLKDINDFKSLELTGFKKESKSFIVASLAVMVIHCATILM